MIATANTGSVFLTIIVLMALAGVTLSLHRKRMP